MHPTARALALLTVLALAPAAAQPVEFAVATPAASPAEAPAPRDSARTADADRQAERARLAELERQLAEVEADQSATVDFSGEVFTQYGVDVAGVGASRSDNSFSLGRWYLTAKSRLSETVGFRGTTDVVATDPAAGLGYTVIVKYAYLDWEARPGVTLRAGVIQTGWQHYVTKLWGYRGVSKTLGHQYKHVSMADVGAAVLAELPADLGSVAVQVQNGSGFRRPEADQFKDVSARAELTPFARTGGALAGVQAGAHVYRGRYDDGTDRVRYGALLGYKGDGYAVAVNAERREDGGVAGQGVSVFGRARVADVAGVGAFSLIGLAEAYDPATDLEDDRSTRGVVGLSYAPNSALSLTLDYQRTSTETPLFIRYDGTTTGADSGVFLHAILKY